MSWNLPFLKPATHIDRLPEAQVKRLYPKIALADLWNPLLLVTAIFYLVRNNLPIVY